MLRFEGDLYQLPARYRCLLIVGALTFQRAGVVCPLGCAAALRPGRQRMSKFERVSQGGFRTISWLSWKVPERKKPSTAFSRETDCEINVGRSQLQVRASGAAIWPWCFRGCDLGSCSQMSELPDVPVKEEWANKIYSDLGEM